MTGLLKNKDVPDYIKEWDLEKNINKANGEMSDLKSKLVERGIGKQPSESYEEYLETIKENVRSILSEQERLHAKDDGEGSESNSDAPEPKRHRTSE